MLTGQVPFTSEAVSTLSPRGGSLLQRRRADAGCSSPSVRDWLPLSTVLFLYDLLCGSADELGSRLAVHPALANG